MHIGLTYTGHSVSLRKFTDELGTTDGISVGLFRCRSESDPSVDCQIRTGSVSSVPTFSWVDQLWLRRQWEQYLFENMDVRNNVLITENALGPTSVRVAESYDIPSIFFIRSLVVMGNDMYNPKRGLLANFTNADFGGKVQFPALVRNVKQYKQGMEQADVVVANSEFTASRLRSQFDVDPEIIYPPITIDEYEVSYTPDGKITMVNPRAQYKGPDIFLDIAKAMPDEEFLLVGDTPNEDIETRASSLPNLEHRGWQDDMKEVYGQSKVVVIPSRYEEPFGRVAAEAMVSGIPVVSSNRGGLPEVVGETGRLIDDIESTDIWVTAIREILDKNTAARRETRQERAQTFSMENQVAHLLELVDDVTDAGDTVPN